MIEIKRAMDVKFEGKYIVCGNLKDLQAVMGCSSVSGNLKYYKVEKNGTKFYIPKEEVLSRIRILESRIRENLEKVHIMRQVVGLDG